MSELFVPHTETNDMELATTSGRFCKYRTPNREEGGNHK